MAHHAIIKNVDELLAKGAIETLIGGTCVCSYIFVVPKHTGGLLPTVNLKQFNHCMHIPTFKMPPIRQELFNLPVKFFY